MKHKRLLCYAAAFFIFSITTSYAEAATFPIIQNFSGAQPADWELRSSAVWNTTVSGDSTLRLTSAGASQSGLGFYDDSFSSDLGIVAEFRYYAGGGTGADGLAFFLVDGDLVDESNIAAGALGGALGYAQSDTPSNGIPHAYLGVGFDEFGNFVTGSGGMDPGSVTSIPDAVVLRGSGNGTTGYDYLTHRDVFSAFGQRIDGGWRIARVTVTPGSSDATIRVEMSWDEGDTWETVIDDYVYNEAPPENLKLGFTGGTGGSTNIHAIGDLNVSLPVDLETIVTVPPVGTYERGDAITYTYTIENHGPNDSLGTVIENTVATTTIGISNLTWNLTSTHGSSSSGTAADVATTTISIPSGETVTVVVAGTVGSNILNITDLDHTITTTPETGSKDPSPADARVDINITSDGPTAAEAALQRIIAYAASNGTTTAPTVDDYDDAGITGVTSGNLADRNTAVADSDADTQGEIQAVVDEAALPDVDSEPVSDIARATALANGTLQRVGDEDIINRGFEYGLTTSYGMEIDISGDALGAYSIELPDLACATVYHVRAYVENVGLNRWYGTDQTFTTGGCSSGGGATSVRSVSAKANANDSSEQTVEEKITALKLKIASLQAKLNSDSDSQGTSLVGGLVRDLTVGMSGEDVKALQILLISEEYSIPAGSTGYFAGQTKAALSAYQAAEGVNPAQGYFGAITRAQMKTAGLSGLWW